MKDMKPVLAADEMFPEGGFMDLEESGSSTGLIDAIDKHVHAEFYNDFDDLFDDEEGE